MTDLDLIRRVLDYVPWSALTVDSNGWICDVNGCCPLQAAIRHEVLTILPTVEPLFDPATGLLSEAGPPPPGPVATLVQGFGYRHTEAIMAAADNRQPWDAKLAALNAEVRADMLERLKAAHL